MQLTKLIFYLLCLYACKWVYYLLHLFTELSFLLLTNCYVVIDRCLKLFQLGDVMCTCLRSCVCVCAVSIFPFSFLLFDS